MTLLLRGKRFVWTVAALSIALLIPNNADAQYLDPGAASIVVQAIIAAAVGVAAGLRFYWARIVGFFGRRRQDDDSLQ